MNKKEAYRKEGLWDELKMRILYISLLTLSIYFFSYSLSFYIKTLLYKSCTFYSIFRGRLDVLNQLIICINNSIHISR